MKPNITICEDMPKIAMPNDPIIVFNQKLVLCYETISTDEEKYAVIRFDDVIEYTLTPINDEGLGKHKYAKYGMRFYSIHRIENTIETSQWSSLGAKYWVYCFKDRTFEIIGNGMRILERKCTREKVKSILDEHTKI